MKASLQIADDVYAAAERLALAENKSVGEVLSDLARRGLESERRQIEEGRFPVFPVSKNSPPITLDTVKTAFDDDL
jgi:hypothetical protein